MTWPCVAWYEVMPARTTPNLAQTVPHADRCVLPHALDVPWQPAGRAPLICDAAVHKCRDQVAPGSETGTQRRHT